jgi:predicted RNase H-like HicB family nuclease
MTYTAIYKRDPDDDAWLVHIHEVAGCHTYGRTLAQARERIREALGLFAEDADTVEIIEDVDIARTAKATIARARRAREKAAEAQEAASSAVREAIARLRGEGLTLRDVGDLLGLSHQRVAKIASDASSGEAA